MALVTPKMSLRVWDQLSDPYNHDQMADNWSKVDLHDHTPGRGVQIPTQGLADGAVTAAKVVGSLDPTSAFTMYKNVHSRALTLSAGVVAGTYALDRTAPITGSPTLAVNAGVAALFIDPADYAATSKTTVYRVRSNILVNATAPTGNYTVGLYPITAVAGGAAALTVTVGAVVSGSTALYTAPVGSLGVQQTSGDFTPPAFGWFALAVLTTATTAASSVIHIEADLQVRQL